MSPNDPRRGEIWLVNFNPTSGDEIRKTRPAIVLSSDAVGVLNLKIVVPLTAWRPEREKLLWLVTLIPDKENGLEKKSSADLLQVRSVSVNRFIRKLGNTRALQMEELLQALAIVLEWS
jgi:mRNA interferase MazF